MTRRKSKSEHREAEKFRYQRIRKLLERGWIQDPNEIPADALPVDPDKINLGGSWHRPIFFRDQPFTCQDCGVAEVWRAADQQWYFEIFHAPYYETAKRCRECRRKERERKVKARIQAGHSAPASEDEPTA